MVGALQALSNIGHVVYARGDMAGAKATFVEALALACATDARKIAAEVLTGLSSVLLAEAATTPGGGSARQAAQALSTAAAITERSGRQMEPIDQEEFDRNLATARTVLGEEVFTEAFEVGREMTLEQALRSIAGDSGARGDLPEQGLRQAAAQSAGGLTARECQVTVLVAEGLSNAVIANRLVLSERTVEMHVSHALHKLGLTSRTQLGAWAYNHGLAQQPR
jgi:DNA-binding CsgD family transcriptional regulator